MNTGRTVLLLLLLLTSSACSPEQPKAQKTAKPSTAGAAVAQSTSAQSISKKVPSATGAYLITLRPKEREFLIGTTQAWIATISDAQGKAFVPNALYFDGGMPGHGHGLPSAPRFTQHLGGTEFLLEGMTLNMPGDWRFVVTVGGPAGVDHATFDLNIQPGPIGQPSPPVATASNNWTNNELALIDSLRLHRLPPASDDSNRFMGNEEAIALGKVLFNETGLSASGEVSCATCHNASLAFADGKPLGFGSKPTQRHTPTLLGIAHANWFYWDGRRDSLWAQAITPIETVGEMDNNRTDAVRFVTSHSNYGRRFNTLTTNSHDFTERKNFPPGASPFGAGKFLWHRMTPANQTLVNQAYASLGKILASFEATLNHTPTRFDRWAAALTTDKIPTTPTAQLSADEQAGLRLFMDLPRTQCLRCHNGPLFSNQGFHNIATSDPSATGSSQLVTHDFGRMLGLQAVIADPFNCSGEYSDAPDTSCDHLRFARRQNLGATIDGAFKVPSLRNLSASAPYLHDGRFSTLEEVVDHYRNQEAGDFVRESEVPDIELTDAERNQLVAFLRAL